MSEAADQPANAGVGGQGDNAPTDEIDTEAFDRVEAPEIDAEDPPADAGDADGADDPDKPKPGSEDDELVEVEFEGKKVKVSAEAKDALLRQADYTRKTTELAESRRQLEEQQSTWESQREESRAALPEEHAKVAVISHQMTAIDKALEGYKQIDWEAWRNQVQTLEADDPTRLKYERFRSDYMAARDSHIDLSDQLNAAKTDLTTKETDRLTKQQEAQAGELAKQRQETGRVLAAEVPGWNAQRAVEVATFMNSDLGIAPEDIGGMTDPKTWKVVDRLMKAEAEVALLKKATKQQQTATNHAKAQESKPAATPRGNGGNARDPATPRGDDLGTKEWMRRRNEQEVRQRSGG